MPLTIWFIFFAFYSALLMLDIGAHRQSAVISVPRALYSTVIWIIIALLFSVLIFGLYEYKWEYKWFGAVATLSGTQAVLQFITSYVLEWSLSVDNIAVIAMILAYLQIPLQHQYRVLFWGIFGAIVLRGLMVIAGAFLIHAFQWAFYLFGAILLWSAIGMLKANTKFDPQRNRFMRVAKRFIPLSDALHDDKFLTKEHGRLVATPLLLSLLFVDLADMVFAVDSIPAVFAVTQDTFLVFTSNAFAILGLRTLYFAVAGMMSMFRYLKPALAIVLALVGVRMLLHAQLRIADGVSLLVVVTVLAIGVVASLWADKRGKKA